MKKKTLYFGGIVVFWTALMVLLITNYLLHYTRKSERQSPNPSVSTEWKSMKTNKTKDEFSINSLLEKSAALNLLPWGVWKQQHARMTRLREICSNLTEKDKLSQRNSKEVRWHFFDNYVYNFRFCFVPKVASKTLQKQFFYRQESIHPSPLGHKTYIKTFVFVREPFLRLLSAYLSKFKNGRKLQLIWEKMFGFEIVKRYRENGVHYVDEWKKAKNANCPTKFFPFLNVTFREFVSYILESGLNTPLNSFTDHWLPQSEISIPCKLRYQFIGKFENLEDDVRFVLEWLGLPNRRPLPVFHESLTGQMFHTEYSQLSTKQILRLNEFYRMDYILFNYNDTWPKKALRLVTKDAYIEDI